MTPDSKAEIRVTARRIDDLIVALCNERAPKSICPSDVARAISPEHFRPLMARVRERAAKLAARKEVVVTQRGKEVDIETVRGPVRISRSPKMLRHDALYRAIDFRKTPELYRVGRGEEGVLTVAPYKSELLPLWKFRTPELAKKSAAALFAAFKRYRDQGDFVGMDMARKFIQMGFTRARRYANHKGGLKYDAHHRALSRAQDPVKAESAQIFQTTLTRLLKDPHYQSARKAWPSSS